MTLALFVYIVIASASLGIFIVLANETPRVRAPFHARYIAIGQMAALVGARMLVLIAERIVE